MSTRIFDDVEHPNPLFPSQCGSNPAIKSVSCYHSRMAIAAQHSSPVTGFKPDVKATVLVFCDGQARLKLYGLSRVSSNFIAELVALLSSILDKAFQVEL